MTRLKSICLFTVTACPTGRSMGMVMQESAGVLEQLEFQTIYVDAEPDKANQYGVSVNPSTLFLGQEGLELYRLEGFHETRVIVRTAVQIMEGSLSGQLPAPSAPENTAEAYEVYLYQENELVPVLTEYMNPTPVKSPRLTAIRQLLRTRVLDCENPFPRSASLDLARFQGSLAKVYICTDEADSGYDRRRAAAALQKTLEIFGIYEVELHSADF